MKKKKRVVKIEWYDPTLSTAPLEYEVKPALFRGYGGLEDFGKRFYLLHSIYPK